MKSATRNNRLIAAFKHRLAEAMLMFLHIALPLLISLNLLLQRSDPLIHILYNALFTWVKQLFRRFPSTELVRKFANYNIIIVQMKREVLKDENILDTNKMFVGFLLCLFLAKKVTSVKESLTSFTNPSVTFIAQLLFTLSTISVTGWVFAAHKICRVFMIINAPFEVFFSLLRSWSRTSIFLTKICVSWKQNICPFSLSP